MKKFLSLALMGALVLGVSSVVYANVCAFDPVPAASLLFPFVAYDYNNGTAGTTTLFAITNVSSEAQIVHVTLWTDFSVAILDFNIILTGYDVQRMNIRDILLNGQLPVTYYEGHTDDEGVISDGPVSENNNLNGAWIQGLMGEPEATKPALLDRCDDDNPSNPEAYDDAIPQGVLTLFKEWLQKSQTEVRLHTDECDQAYDPDDGYVPAPTPWFEARDDSTDTWMYITADVVQVCNKLFPDNPDYWVPGYLDGGVARYDNVLIGDVQWVNALERFSESDNAVHLEADLNLDLVATESPLVLGRPVSFYHRYTWDAGDSDWREPLPTAWAFRYQGAESAAFGTKIRAWKGGIVWDFVYDLAFYPVTESPAVFVASNCWAYTYYAWDDEENVNSATTNPWSQPGGESVIPNLLPLETQEVEITQFNTVDDFGWMLFVWPNSNVDGLTQGQVVGETYDWYQTWMGVKYYAFGDYSAAMSGIVMANYNCFSQQVLPQLGVNGYGDGDPAIPVAGMPYVDPVLNGYTVSEDRP